MDVTSDDLLEAMEEPAELIVRSLQELLEQTPPELMGDVYSDGGMLTGGSAQIYGMNDLLSQRAKLPVWVAEDPQFCVAKGAGLATKYIGAMEDTNYGGLNPLSSAY